MVPHDPQPTLADEIDIGALKSLVARFKRHHSQRLAATRQSLTPRRRRALGILPFLYHRNHPALPGYISSTLPAGIAHYRPSSETRKDLRLLTGGFRDHRERGGVNCLHAVYLMGSSGSIAQTRASDVDVWVCCPSHLHAALWPKVHVINQWASSQGLTLQTFLVDPERFRSGGAIPGCATPTLLLDEFYRSATLIAGRYPLWWLVPPGQEDDHARLGKRLRESRYLDPDAIIDFGPVKVPRLVELAHGATEELSRALATPYKSLLKLKLVEAYAHRPQAPPVSHRYKQAIYAGQEDPAQLDAYILVYQHLEAHLIATDQPEQLTLTRRLLARKILHAETSANERTAELCQQLGVDPREILEPASYSSLVRESAQVNAALQAGLRTAADLDRQHHAPPRSGIRAEDHANNPSWPNRHAMRLEQLRRMVESLTSITTDTITHLNPAVAPAQYAAPIAVQKKAGAWIASEGGQVIYQCSRLVELAVWAHVNNLTNLDLVTGHALEKNLEKNLQQIRLALQTASQKNGRFQVFANAEINSQPRDGATLLSRQDDPLAYSGLHRLHLETLDTVVLSSNNNCQVRSASSRGDLLLELARLMSNRPQDLAWEAIGNQRRYRIQTRLKTLHTQLYGALRQDGDQFIFPFGGDLVCAEKRHGSITTTVYASAQALQMALRGQAQRPVTFDNSTARLAALQ